MFHALTGDSHVAGDAGPGHRTAGWWGDVVGPGRAIDTDRWFVVAPNMLGGCQGSTGPSSVSPDGVEWGSRFPFVTVRDQVAAQAQLADTLGIERFAAVVGGSMGGMHALEFAAVPAGPGGAARGPEQHGADDRRPDRGELAAARGDPDGPGFAGGDYYEAEAGAGRRAGCPWRGGWR